MDDRAFVTLAALAVVVAACTRESDPTALRLPLKPSFLISDAVHDGGTPGFYFLPPMVSQPTFSGTFDTSLTTLNPQVAICDVTSGPDVNCGGSSAGATPAIVVFTTTSSPAITLDLSTPQYQVNWDTKGTGFAVGHTYRVHVSAGAASYRRELGFADILLTTTPGQVKHLATDSLIVLQDGRTLPVHVRIRRPTPAGAIVDGVPLPPSRRAEHYMGMPAAARHWTAEMVRALPEDGRRYEVIAGELFVTPAPSFDHQDAVAKVFLLLNGYLKRTGAGYAAFSPADIAFDEHTLVQPDLFVVPLMDGRRPRRWTDIARLLLAVEVLSPSTARADRTVKRQLFQRVGVPEYWIVDVEARLIERWRPGDTRPEIVSDSLEWQPDPRHAPLRIDLPGLFAAILE